MWPSILMAPLPSAGAEPYTPTSRHATSRGEAIQAPESYVPSIVEWGVSIGLIAATIFLFGLAARLMPVLSKAQPVETH